MVHGGIDRNSSKVKKRGLQHFQPIQTSQSWIYRWLLWKTKRRADTFLALMEYRRAWVIDAFLVRVGEGFAAGLVHTLLSHSPCSVAIRARSAAENMSALFDMKGRVSLIYNIKLKCVESRRRILPVQGFAEVP